MKFSNELKGTLFVLLAAVCWSINSPIVKYLTLNPFLICGLRSLIAGITLLPFCGSGKSRKPLPAAVLHFIYRTLPCRDYFFITHEPCHCHWHAVYSLPVDLHRHRRDDS